MRTTEYDPTTAILNVLADKRPDVYQNQKDGIKNLLKPIKAGNYFGVDGWVLYFFVNKKHREVDYIGITKNLSRRMPSHEKLNTLIHDIVIIETKDEEATKELEHCFIRDFQPRLNYYL